MDNGGGRLQGIIMRGLILTAAVFVFGANSAHARTNVSADMDITAPTTWTKEAGPYVISGWAWLDVKAALTIEPGTVIKFTPDHWNKRYNGILVSGGGKIVAQGTSTAPIIFTSYYDDTADGDTNGDNSNTTPARGDWRGLVFDNDQSELSYAEIRYAGNIYQSYGALEARNGSQMTLSDSIIQYSGVSGLRLNEPLAVDISNTTIADSADFGLYSTVSGSSITLGDIIFRDNSDGIATLAAGNTLSLENPSFSGNAPVVELAGTNITSDAVWPSFGNDASYIIRNDIGIASGSTLTIDAGAVIKGENSTYPDSRLEVLGRLVAQGTADQPIVFTSLRDDTVGGDTNNDGNATSPAKDDWGGLYFENSSDSVLNYVTMRYGGNYDDDFNGVFYSTTDDTMIHLKNSSLSVATSTIGIADTAVYLEGTSSLTMSGSTVATTTTGVLSSSSLGSTIAGSAFANNTTAVNNSGAQIDARNNWWGDNSGPNHVDNPDGIGQVIAGNVLFDPWTKYLDPVIIVPGILGSWNVLGQWELDPILNTYDNLWEAMKDAGYLVDQTLFAFPYNWRLSNTYTAGLLKDKIDEVKGICGCGKVDIVAHSMGGLVARAYVELLDYENDIDQLIFLGVPHKGATSAYLTWEAGEIGPDPFDKLVRNILLLDALKSGYVSVFSYVREMPMESVRELLPIYDYLEQEDQTLMEYPENYPQNTFLDLLNNESKLSLLDNVNELINIRADSGNNSTIRTLRVINYAGNDGKWEHGFPEGFDERFIGDGIIYDSGDKTVPNISNESFLGLQDVIVASNHRDMVTDAQKKIIKELTGTEPAENVDRWEFANWLMVRIFSPADFKVIAPDGKVIGKDFENNTSVNQIDGAFYSGFDSDIEFAVIPDPMDGDYQVMLQGTGEGEYKLVTDYISDTEEVTHETTGQAVPEQQVEYHITYSSADVQNMSVAPEDTEPPQTAIGISGTSVGTDAYLERATVTLSSTDSNSGVYTIQYSVDDGASWTLYTGPITLDTIGDVAFSYRATDNVGNAEATQTKTIRIQAQQQGAVPVYIFQPPAKSNEPQQAEMPAGQGEVLGESAKQDAQYFTDSDILSALADGNLETLLDYLGIERDVALEASVTGRYGTSLPLERKELANFIAYGTKSTQALGAGERAGVLHSYREAFGTIPEKPDDWLDIINIATGTIPVRRSVAAEQRAEESFEKIYGRKPDVEQKDDKYAMLTIAYGLRPEQRDLTKEAVAIQKFATIYKTLPHSASEWDAVRCIAYSSVQ